jgi:hypothetical protein
MIKPLIKVIMLAVTWGVIAHPPPLERNLIPRWGGNKSDEVLICYMDGRNSGSWIAGILNVPMWFHLRNDHSIEPCRTE